MEDASVYGLETIVGQGLCTGCGLCEGIAGSDVIQLQMRGEGSERPTETGPLDSSTLRLINQVCPGLRSSGRASDAGDPAVEVHPIWGPARMMALGHAADPAVRHHASSGGALSALATHLLSSGEVDFILHVSASKSQPARSERTLSFDAAQVMEASGSRYGPAAPLSDFKAVLDLGLPFAFIGKACDIQAIRNYARFDPRVDQLVRYTLNFFCGGVSKFAKTMDYVRRSGLNEEDLAEVRYRGDGCPGPMVLKSRDGRTFNYSYNEVWEDESRWQLQFRCKICPDALGDLADISVADVWPGGRPSEDGLGFNGFIARTTRGERLLRNAVDAGAITLTGPLTFADLELVQGHQMRKKQAIKARLDAMRDAGALLPSFEDLRLEQAEAMIKPAKRRAEYLGTRERLDRGDNLED
jgi:coenzyme F420 hydrogenase subunit beta